MQKSKISVEMRNLFCYNVITTEREVIKKHRIVKLSICKRFKGGV